MNNERAPLATILDVEAATGTGATGAKRQYDQRPPRRTSPGCLLLSGMVVTILVLSLLLAALSVRRTVDQLLFPPTPTIEPTPDISRLGLAPVIGPPSIDVALIRQVLRSYHSPAEDDAQIFYDAGVARGIDPAYCLAFFIVESAAGTRGVARTTYSIGNIRARAGEPSYEGYRLYGSWREGIEDWYRLIAELYVRDWNLTTLDQIVPVYAPGHDQNDPAAYTLSIKRLVARWRGY